MPNFEGKSPRVSKCDTELSLNVDSSRIGKIHRVAHIALACVRALATEAHSFTLAFLLAKYDMIE
ncbi:MAG: hypothetical protein ACRD6X_13395 [Pyrinomonadaceae bacterium]